MGDWGDGLVLTNDVLLEEVFGRTTVNLFNLLALKLLSGKRQLERSVRRRSFCLVLP